MSRNILDNNFDSLIINTNVNNDLNCDYNDEVDGEHCDDTSALGHGVEVEVFVDNALTDQLVDDDQDLNVKLETICRCCLSENEQLKSIYDIETCIFSMIYVLTSIESSPEDGLPGGICDECLVQLTKCINFKEQVQTADMTLKRYVTEGYLQGMELQKLELHHILKRPDGSEYDINPITDKIYTSEGIQHITVDDSQDEEEQDSYSSIPEDDNNASELDDAVEINLPKPVGRHKIVSTKRSTSKASKRAKRKVFVCSICEKKFSNQQILVRHAKIHSQQKSYFPCTVCARPFRDSASLECHMRCHQSKTSKLDDSTESFKCDSCEMSFTVESDLFIHGSIHNTNDGFICRDCHKEFASCVKLKRHVKTHFEDKPFKCEECGRGFPEMGSLTRHFRLHTGEKRDKKHSCTVCGKRYYDAHSLSVHIRTHTGEKPWECSICGKRFIDSRLLNSHMKIHNEEKLYSCDRCDKRFTHPSTLTTHIRTHTGEKPYVCSVCNKSFIQSSNLSLHMRVHSGERPYKCTECTRAFASSSTLTTHMRTHTGEKPYYCPQCGKRFARYDLSAHMRTHTGEKPYECSICSRKFTTSGQLSQHKRTHTGEKPFACKVCGKRWSTSVYLRKHMRVHEKVDDTEEEQQCTDGHVSPTETILFTTREHILEAREEDLQSEAEFNENTVLVNDLLAAVVGATTTHIQVPVMTTNDATNITLEMTNAINPSILRFQRNDCESQTPNEMYILRS